MANKNYLMPITCKEIYLPFGTGGEWEDLTPEQYKEITGVDIRDVFVVYDGHLQVKSPSKIYLLNINENEYNFNIAQPLMSFDLDGDYNVFNKHLAQNTFAIKVVADEIALCGAFDNN